MLITASEYLNNLNTEKHYTGVFHYTRPVRSRHDKYVEMYGLLSVKSDVAIPGNNIAKFAWDGIVDGFEYSKADSTNDALKIALTEATRRIKQLITNDKEISEHGVDINFSVYVSSVSGVYVGCLGECDIYIYKNGKIVDIYEMLSQKGAKTAGLVLEEGDILFASTVTFLKRHMSEFVGLPSSGSILNKIDEIAENLDNGEGILLFTKNEDDDSGEQNIQQSNSDEETPPVVEKRVNTALEEGKVPEKNKKRENVKVSFAKIKEKVLPVLGVLKPVGVKFKELLAILGSFFRRIYLNILEILNKKKWFKKASAKISQSMPKREGFKSFKVDGYRVKNKKVQRFKTAILVVLSIVVIVGGIKFTVNEKEARDISKRANDIFTNIEKFLSSAEDKKNTDRSEAELLVFRAEGELKKIPDGLREKDSEKLEDLQGRVLGIQDDLYKRTGLSDSDGSLETYIGTRIAFGEGSKPSDIAIYQDGKGNEYILVADTGLKAVFRVSLYDKNVQRVPDTESILQEPSMVYIGKNGLYVMDTKVGVVKAEFDSDGWFTSFIKLTGLGIDNIGAEDIAEFAVLTDSDNVYVLDRKKGVLLKASNYGSGYGMPFKYIEEDELVSSNDIFADLSTYILTSGVQGLRRYIYSYTEGKLVLSALEIVGVNGEFKNLSYGYTRGDLTYDMYVFDSEDKRILRLEKPIESGKDMRHPNQAVLKNQYVYRGSRKDVWNSVKDLVVARDQKTLYILDSSTVWKIRL